MPALFVPLTLGLLLVLLVSGSSAAEQMVGIDATVTKAYAQTVGVNPQRTQVANGGTIAGFSPTSKPGTGWISMAVVEFALPRASEALVRSATLQVTARRMYCSGSEPVVFDVYGHPGDGQAGLTHAMRGARIHQMTGGCSDSPAFAEPIDVSSFVRQQLAAGSQFAGFSVRLGRARRNDSTFFFSPIKLTVTLAESEVAAVAPGSAGSPGSQPQTEGAPSAASRNPVAADIVGLRLGMTPDEVQRTLKAHNPALKVGEERGRLEEIRNESFLSMITADLGKRLPIGPVETIAVHFPPQPHAPRAIFLERFSGFPEGQQPLFSTVKDALVRKFGSASFLRDTGNEIAMLWTFNGAGVQIVDNTVYRRCAKFPPTDPLRRGQNVFFTQTPTDGCGVTVYVKMEHNYVAGSSPPRYGELITYMSTSIIDDSGFAAMRAATRAYIDKSVRDAGRTVAPPKL